MDKGEREIFDEGFDVLSSAQRNEWKSAVENAKKEAQEMGVEFIYPDQSAFAEVVEPLKEEVISKNDKLQPYYEKINDYNNEFPAKEAN